MAKIVIVDDSKLARSFAAAVLKRAGHQVSDLEPTDLEGTLQDLRSLAPDLMVVDHNMPGCPGPTLVRACFQDPELERVKVVMLTAHHDDEIRSRMEKLGVAMVLYKPVDPGTLAEAVASALEVR